MGNKKNSKKHKKTELVFDNKKREKFLTGFSKRKKQRQKKAQDEMQLKLKEERKRIKLESKNLKEKFKHSFKPIEELQNIISDEESENNFEDDDVKVTITSIEPALHKKFAGFIGYRKNEESEDEREVLVESCNKANEIPGMEIERKNSKEGNSSSNKLDKIAEGIKSEKDFKKLIKKQTKTAIKKSKIIQKKNQLNHKRNVKLAHRKRFVKEKFLKKHKKIPKHKN